MVEVGGFEAQKPLALHPEAASLPELAPAFRTRRVPDDRDDDDVPGITPRRRAVPGAWSWTRLHSQSLPLCVAFLILGRARTTARAERRAPNAAECVRPGAPSGSLREVLK